MSTAKTLPEELLLSTKSKHTIVCYKKQLHDVSTTIKKTTKFSITTLLEKNTSSKELKFMYHLLYLNNHIQEDLMGGIHSY